VRIPGDWLEFRRSDRELVGWLRPLDEGWVPVDLLGRDAAPAPLDLDRAEALLDERGLSFLAERWLLDHDGTTSQVRIAEVSPDRVVVLLDDFGLASAVIPGREPVRWTLPWPAPETLRLR